MAKLKSKSKKNSSKPKGIKLKAKKRKNRSKLYSKLLKNRATKKANNKISGKIIYRPAHLADVPLLTELIHENSKNLLERTEEEIASVLENAFVAELVPKKDKRKKDIGNSKADSKIIGAQLTASKNGVSTEAVPIITGPMIVGPIIIGCAILEVYNMKISEIRSVAVRKGYRKLGIGEKLVKLVCKRAKDLGVRQILAVTSNLEFFKKVNFTECLHEKYALFWNGK